MRGYRNYSADPHPGELREQIDIEREVNTINANGYPETVYITIAKKVWTAIDDAGNQAFRAGDSEIAQNVFNFVIRHRRDVAVGMFVLFEGQRRLIVDIGHYGFKKTYLGFKTMLNQGVTK